MWQLFLSHRRQVESLVIADVIEKFAALGINPVLKSKDFPRIENNDRLNHFDNRSNFYLKLLDLLKRFTITNDNNLLQYFFEHLTDLRHPNPEILWQMRLEHLSDFLTRLEVWRRSSDQFQFILGLLYFQSRKLIKLYLKMRSEVLKYSKEAVRDEHLPVSNHNRKKYEGRDEQTTDNIMINIELWSVLAVKTLEGTPYSNKINTDRILQYIREAEVKEHTVGSIMKIKASTLFLLTQCVLVNVDKLFKQTEPTKIDNPEIPLQVQKKNKEMEDTIKKDKFLETLLQSKMVKVEQNSPVRKTHGNEIEDIIVRPKESILYQSRSEKVQIDYSYRLASNKKQEQAKQIVKPPSPMMTLQTSKSVDPLILDIKKYMKRYARQLNRDFTLTR